MTNKEFILSEIDNLKDMLENSKELKCETIIKACEEGIKQYNQVLKELEDYEKLKKIKLMLKQKECVLRYVASEDCFAVRCILDDKWYKLTDDLIKNNIKEEVKPMPLIDKVKELKEKVEKQDKILETLNRPMLYSERKKLGEEYIEWAKENNIDSRDLTSVITWCFCFKMKELV